MKKISEMFILLKKPLKKIKNNFSNQEVIKKIIKIVLNQRASEKNEEHFQT